MKNNLKKNIADTINTDALRKNHAERDFNPKDALNLHLLDVLELQYGKRLFEETIGGRIGEVSKLREKNSKVMLVSFNDCKRNNSPFSYEGCDFQEGTISDSKIYTIKLDVNDIKPLKINFGYVVHIISIDKILSTAYHPNFTTHRLMQYTFYTKGDKHGLYLGDIVDTNPISASHSMINRLENEFDASKSVHLKKIQIPEPGYLHKVNPIGEGFPLFFRSYLSEIRIAKGL